MGTLNVLDIILLIIMVLAAIGGWRTSGASRVGRLAGLLLGAVLGLALARTVTPADAGTGLRIGIAIGLLLLGAVVLGGLGGWVGRAVARGLRSLRLGVADRLLGALLSGVLALLVCWVLLTVATMFWPDSGLATVTVSSRLIEAVDNTLPDIAARVM